MNPVTPLIAVISADTAYLELLSELLSDEGYHCICYHSNVQAPRRIRRDHPDLVILDLPPECSYPGLATHHAEAGGWGGLEAAQPLPKHPQNPCGGPLAEIWRDCATGAIPTIVSSTNGPLLRSQEQELRTHNGAIIEKPFDIECLLAKVAEAIGVPLPLSA
jgi:CheY-like chemotaxis protein